MTTVTLPNATDAASFESDLDTVNSGTANTDYIIPITQDITIANTDADTFDNNGMYQAADLPTGSTLTLSGTGTLTIAPSDALVVVGQMTAATAVVGDITLYEADLITGAATTTGTTTTGGVITGYILGNGGGNVVQNAGEIVGTGTYAINLPGGSVINESGATITDATADAYTIYYSASGILQNAGTISGTGSGSFGAVFVAGGTLTNGGFGETTQAVLSGQLDGAIFGTAGTVSNDGAISAITGNGLQFIAGGTVTNGSSTDSAATIISSSQTGAGIIAASGSVTNSATIQGGEFGVQFSSGVGAVTNTGTIAATDASGDAGAGNVVAGVALVGGGNVTNGPSNGTVAGSASITAADVAVDVLGGTSTVVNSGTLSATIGINFTGPGGVDATGQVTDYGAITSTAGTTGSAILFGTGAEKLVLEQGFAITGQVAGGANTGDTTAIEVAAGTTGTFSGLTGGAGTVSNGDGSAANGFGFTNVQTIDIDSSASWAFSGANTLSTLHVDGAATVTTDGSLTTTLDPTNENGTLTVAAGGTLELVAATGAGNTIDLAGSGALLTIDAANSFGTTSGSTVTGDVIGQFAAGSDIDLANVAFGTNETKSFNASTNVLMVSDGTNTANITFTPGLFSTLGNFVITTDGLGGTLIAVPCYCPGTRITTPSGEIEVEKLAIGDLVTMIDGRSEPIRWIGRRTYAGRFLAANPKVRPIRFCKGSLGKGLPRRDLLVSPQHAMFINGMLIPAHCLVNGSSITVDATPKVVDYIHIEFANHEVILAEGAASESFIDDDSRGMFHNANEYAELYPDAPAPVAYYAERVDGGFEVEAVRTKLAKIATQAANRRRARKLKAA